MTTSEINIFILKSFLNSVWGILVAGWAHKLIFTMGTLGPSGFPFLLKCCFCENLHMQFPESCELMQSRDREYTASRHYTTGPAKGYARNRKHTPVFKEPTQNEKMEMKASVRECFIFFLSFHPAIKF